VMLCLVRQRPHLRRDGKQRLLRRVGVDGELVGALLRVPLDVEPEKVEPSSRWQTLVFSAESRSPKGVSSQSASACA
jgi:hypothetical protein